MFTLHARVSVCSTANTIVGLEISVYAMGLKADRHYMKAIYSALRCLQIQRGVIQLYTIYIYPLGKPLPFLYF